MTLLFLRLQNLEETKTKLHMVTPARKREPRSGKRRVGKYRPVPVKGYQKRKAEKPKSVFSSSSSSVFSVTSDISCYNQGVVSSNRNDVDEGSQEEYADIVQDSLPLADSLEVRIRIRVLLANTIQYNTTNFI